MEWLRLVLSSDERLQCDRCDNHLSHLMYLSIVAIAGGDAKGVEEVLCEKCWKALKGKD